MQKLFLQGIFFISRNHPSVFWTVSWSWLQVHQILLLSNFSYRELKGNTRTMNNCLAIICITLISLNTYIINSSSKFFTQIEACSWQCLIPFISLELRIWEAFFSNKQKSTLFLLKAAAMAGTTYEQEEYRLKNESFSLNVKAQSLLLEIRSLFLIVKLFGNHRSTLVLCL